MDEKLERGREGFFAACRAQGAYGLEDILILVKEKKIPKDVIEKAVLAGFGGPCLWNAYRAYYDELDEAAKALIDRNAGRDEAVVSFKKEELFFSIYRSK
ncbi:hypothetical protein A2303_03080 [Candidatus Falkowbacteria bacterium RIFOXYB2_FULL_47_14]|uniref:Uncharacterized protein n=1 Tax=Candidatus Falkowbacteria bacterium RIFOXYA2_FULL_47_19 TaxID=1797994 RepID=A0A1F5SG82_9BACT|nr:MAG: hypothetical protein A2227_07895 [Candidatus Falkowbacteria bacterium RIFOXYA2_FULL_47_19]OGF35172.1 MAG: hypothetical protein A2468_01915 [Candidatus Falkowbacteria bacterium RIFOXYC2_FULL_46_15]OGF43337.1 MAG: hypothetical protein A2303_03080 [Candidatus Falkowbacteria bacterium RIFOXYB2_FULL_47_14]